MKQFSLSILLTLFMSMGGINAFAASIEQKNADGVLICYNYINNYTELEVTYLNINVKNFYKNQVVIPEEITYNNKTLKVTRIGWGAFKDCTSLTSISIPKSVKSIGGSAFKNCTGLKKVIINDIAAWCVMKFESDLGERISNPLICAHHLYKDENTEIKDLVIPEGVWRIGTYAFIECTGLISVSIPKSVTRIEEYAFRDCTGLKKVIVKDIASWCKISWGTWSWSDTNNPLYYARHLYKDYNTEIKDLVIPNGVERIECFAFQNCDGLTSITIPNSVYLIASNAFNCDNVTTVVSLVKDPNTIAISNISFCKNILNNATLYVPSGTIDKYKDTFFWKDFASIVEGKPNNIANVKSMPVLIQGDDGVLQISGAPEGTVINVYEIGGQLVGSAKASSDTTVIPTTLPQGSIAIVKIGEKAVKVLMK